MLNYGKIGHTSNNCSEEGKRASGYTGLNKRSLEYSNLKIDYKNNVNKSEAFDLNSSNNKRKNKVLQIRSSVDGYKSGLETIDNEVIESERNVKKRKVSEIRVEELENEFGEIFINSDKAKFFEVEKCGIETMEEKMVVKKGDMTPQCYRKKIRNYLAELKGRGIIKE